MDLLSPKRMFQPSRAASWMMLSQARTCRVRRSHVLNDAGEPDAPPLLAKRVEGLPPQATRPAQLDGSAGRVIDRGVERAEPGLVARRVERRLQELGDQRLGRVVPPAQAPLDIAL